jgi:hypothetical protein
LESGDLWFALLSYNPFGGLLVSIPFAVFHLKYSAMTALVAGVPFAYMQVPTVDVFWNQLNKWERFKRFVEGKRSPRIEKMMESKGAFWPILIFSPIVGPWLVMAFMRYANVPQRRVAAPLFLGLTWVGVLIASACVFLPQFVQK